MSGTPPPPLPQKGAKAWDGPLNTFLTWVAARFAYYNRSEVALRDRLTVIETYMTVPALDDIKPAKAKVGASLTLTIRNIAAGDADKVTIGGKEAAKFKLSGNTITAEVAAGTPTGVQPVVVLKDTKRLAWRSESFEVEA